MYDVHICILQFFFISNVFKKKGSQKLLDLKGIKIHVIHLVDNILHCKLNLGVISVHACMRVCLWMCAIFAAASSPSLRLLICMCVIVMSYCNLFQSMQFFLSVLRIFQELVAYVIVPWLKINTSEVLLKKLQACIQILNVFVINVYDLSDIFLSFLDACKYSWLSRKSFFFQRIPLSKYESMLNLSWCNIRLYPDLV